MIATAADKGALQDIFGRKYTLLVCVSVFTVGSLACALAPSVSAPCIRRSGIQSRPAKARGLAERFR